MGALRHIDIIRDSCGVITAGNMKCAVVSRADHFPPAVTDRAPEVLVTHKPVELQAQARREQHEVKNEPCVRFARGRARVVRRIDPVLYVRCWLMGLQMGGEGFNLLR